jgi:hypothetical protein
MDCDKPVSVSNDLPASICTNYRFRGRGGEGGAGGPVWDILNDKRIDRVVVSRKSGDIDSMRWHIGLPRLVRLGDRQTERPPTPFVRTACRRVAL